MTKWAIAEERRDLIALMTRDGKTAEQIAEELNVTPRTVFRARAERGYAKPRREFTADEIHTAEAMFDDGCSFAEVGRTIGRATGTVAKHWPGRGWTKAQCGEWAALIRKLAL